MSGFLALGVLSSVGLAVSGLPALAASGGATPATEGFSYPNDEAVPGITLVRGDGRIELADCAGLGAGLLRVRSSVREQEFCFDVKGPGGYLALELRKTYQLRGDGEHQVEAELTVNGVPRDEPLAVPTTTWASLPVVAGADGHTLVELRSEDELPSGTGGNASQGSYPFVGRVHIGDAADGGLACSGALVDQRWVITSKSCLVKDGQPVTAGTPKRPTKVTLGRPDVSGAGSGLVASVLQVVPHPDRDVALLRLAAAVTAVAPVKLATSPPAMGDVLRVAGYGRTATAWAPDASHVASFSVSEVAGTSIGIAGQSPDQVGPCQGDAGGPGLREAGGGIELVALTSTAALGGCRGSVATEGRGGTQTRLDDLAGWVQQQVSASTVNVLIDESSKMCLAVSGASTESGSPAIQWNCGGGAEQDWQIKARTGGKFELRNDRSGMCLAVSGGSKENGAPVVQWPCRDANVDQTWQLTRDARGYTELRNANSGQCLAIPESSKERGKPVVQWPCREATLDQNWQIRSRVEGRLARNANSSLCLSTAGDLSDGSPTVQAGCDVNDAEWQVSARAGGYAELRNDRSGLCLSIPGGSKEEGVSAVSWPCRAANRDQVWLIDVGVDGLTRLRNENSGLCLAIPGASKSVGVAAVQWPCRGAASKEQYWRF